MMHCWLNSCCTVQENSNVLAVVIIRIASLYNFPRVPFTPPSDYNIKDQHARGQVNLYTPTDSIVTTAHEKYTFSIQTKIYILH